MRIIFALLSKLGLAGRKKKGNRPAADAKIMEMSLWFSGMVCDDQYQFSLAAKGDTVIFCGKYYTFSENNERINHRYEDVVVDWSYLVRLRELAEETKLVEGMFRYCKPKQKYELLDDASKTTSITMSDGTQKTVDTTFDSSYYIFFVSVAEAYAEQDCGEW